MTQTCIYVSCAGSSEICVFTLDPLSGEMKPCQRISTGNHPQPMKIAPGNRVLYVGTRAEDRLLAYAINPADGSLRLIGSVPCPGPATYVSCDQSTRTAFAASYGGNLLAVFPLDAGGAPQPARQVEHGLARAHAALPDGSNRWLLVPTLGADAIRIYRLAAQSPYLSPNEPAYVSVRPGSGPRHLVFSPDNRQVHCVNELDGTIDAFAFDAQTGTLKLKQSVSLLPPGFSGQPWAAELRATPDGRFLYATERRSSMLAAFAVDSAGGLALIDHYPAETQPRGMGIDPSGRWLAVAGQLSGHLALHALDPHTGRLTPHARHATGDDPICVEIATF